MPNPNSRPIFLTREGEFIRLAFSGSDLTGRVRKMPYARQDPGNHSWLVYLCDQTLSQLRALFYEGLVVNYPDELLEDGEELPECREALLRAGRRARPFLVHTAWRDDRLWARLTSVPTAEYSKRQKALTYAPQAAVALGELVDAGVLDDPDRLLTPGEITVGFDGRDGRFKVRLQDQAGDRGAAQAAFDHYFPKRDPVGGWQSQGHTVAFTDPSSQEVYAGEIARNGEGLQPAGLKLDLYDYQRRGVGYAVARSGGTIADQPGLGKTASAIATAYELMANRQLIERVVIVAPAGVRTHWAQEITRFTGHEDVVVIDGTKAQRAKCYEAAKHARWIAVHYEVLRRDWDLEQMAELAKNSMVVVDEAHRIRNHQTKTSKAVRTLGRAASHRLALTGTPIENAPDEFYWVLSFATPGALGRWSEFAERYMYPGRFGGYEGARNLSELAKRAAPHFLRRLKSDVATHLPPLRVQHMPLDVADTAYSSLLRRVHQQAREELADAARDRSNADAPALQFVRGWDDFDSAAEMTAVGMLRMLCSSPQLLRLSDSPSARALVDAGLVPDIDGPKVDQIREFANELQGAGERVVVFSGFKTMIDLLADRLSEDGVRYVTYTGDTKRKDRDIATARFNDPDDQVTVFLCTDAAAEGLNLGRCCSTLINADLPYTATRLEQRSNRIHRVDGTASSYLVINLTVRGTIEEGLWQLVSRKANLMDDVFDEQGASDRTAGLSDSEHRELRDVLSDVIGPPITPTLPLDDVTDTHDDAA